MCIESCRRRYPSAFFYFFKLYKRKTYLSDYLFLVLFSSSLLGTYKFMSKGCSSYRTWVCMFWWLLYLPHWSSIRGNILLLVILYLKEIFLPAPLDLRMLSISDLSAVNMNSPHSCYLFKWSAVGRDLRDSFGCFPEQSLKFTVNKLFDHDFIAPVSPKPLDWSVLASPTGNHR